MFIVRHKHNCDVHRFHTAREVALFMWGRDVKDYEIYTKVYEYPANVRKMEELLNKLNELIRKKDDV